MPDNIQLPFLETKISFFDLQNLDKNGFLRSIFIELLKANKIKNVFPTEFEINQTKNEFCLEFNINELNKKKDRQNFLLNLNKEINKLAKLKKYSLLEFSIEAKRIFEIRKAYHYDQYFYSLLRNKNKSQVFEFYYQIESNESNINNLSREHSSGSEKSKLGIIGPVTLVNINPKIAEILKFSEDSIINNPIEINNEWYLIQREKFIPAEYNSFYENQICMELLERELEKEYQEEYINLMNNNC